MLFVFFFLFIFLLFLFYLLLLLLLTGDDCLFDVILSSVLRIVARTERNSRRFFLFIIIYLGYPLGEFFETFPPHTHPTKGNPPGEFLKRGQGEKKNDSPSSLL